jgi:uncharacterized membrane protein YfcA
VSPELNAVALALCAGFVLTAYFIRGIVGFGSGLIAIPLLALILPLHVVVPAIALTDYLASVSQGVGNRRDILWRAILPLVPFVLVGAAIALYLFRQVDPGLLSKGLGVFVICYAGYTLLGLHTGRIAGPQWAAPLGGIGAMIGTLFGTGGPFYVAYLQLWGPNKGQFRATAATAFLIEGSTRMTGYLVSGFFTREVLLLFVLALPLTGLGLYAGHHVHTSIGEATFKRLIGVLLIGSGLALLLK